MTEEVVEKNLMEVEEKNSLVVSDTNNIFDNSNNFKEFTTIDIEDEEAVDSLLNGLQEVDHILNECVGQVINVTNIYCTERQIDNFNSDTGEVVSRKKHVLMLFDENGESYVTGSNACFNSFRVITRIKGMPSKENPIKMQVIKTQAKEKGHSYLRLKYIK